MKLFAQGLFTQPFADEFRADPQLDPHRPRRVAEAYSRAAIEPGENSLGPARLMAFNAELARAFDMGASDSEAFPSQTAAILGGQLLLPGMRPIAHNYGGHQFGNWADQLGDGRALSLGVWQARPDTSPIELQLKGAARTAYSRHADGRAVLRSSVREYVASEAMNALGVPTTRALSLILTGDAVVRDPQYSGERGFEAGAVLCRTAESFLRFGHFELPAARNDLVLLQQLWQYLCRTAYTHLPEDQVFAELCERSAIMIAHWQRVGFVHAVMNTDNMSAIGLTLDYGPFGFLDDFNPNWTPNTTDRAPYRYAYGKQPDVMLWNLQKLAQALSLILPHALLLEGLQRYQDAFNAHHQRMSWGKFGLRISTHSAHEQSQISALIAEFFTLMRNGALDFTLSFQVLQNASQANLTPAFSECLAAQSYAKPDSAWHAAAQDWWQRYRAVAKESDTFTCMAEHNPLYVPRNFLLQEVIEAFQGDQAPSELLPKIDFEAGSTALTRLLAICSAPYSQHADVSFHQYASRLRPAWAINKPGCSSLSCSS